MVPLASNAQIGGTRHARILGRRRLRHLVDLSVGLRRPLAYRDRTRPVAGSVVVEERPQQHPRRRGGATRALRARRDRHRRISAPASRARGAMNTLLIAQLAGALLFTTDRLVPRGDIRRFKHVVAVFPHADDETVTCGGTLQRFAASGALVTLVLLTGGERGNPAGVMQAELADRRRAE